MRITRIDDEGLKEYVDEDPDSIEIGFVRIEPKITKGRITKVEWDREDGDVDIDDIEISEKHETVGTT